MPVLSVLRKALPFTQNVTRNRLLNGIQQLRHDSHQTMPITASRWQWHKFKDLLHFYLMLGIIPFTALVAYVNIFIGPAQLAEIPKGYTPEKWEYYKHPISRWMAKHLYPSHQEEYEKYLHYMHEEHEQKEMMEIYSKVKRLMYERGDSKGFLYRAPPLEYIMGVRKDYDEQREYLTDAGISLD